MTHSNSPASNNPPSPDELSTLYSLHTFWKTLKEIQEIVSSCSHKDDPCLQKITALISDEEFGLINLITQINPQVARQELDADENYIKSPFYRFSLARKRIMNHFRH